MSVLQLEAVEKPPKTPWSIFQHDPVHQDPGHWQPPMYAVPNHPMTGALEPSLTQLSFEASHYPALMAPQACAPVGHKGSHEPIKVQQCMASVPDIGSYPWIEGLLGFDPHVSERRCSLGGLPGS